MIKRKEQYKEIKHLTVTENLRVRFNETDPLGIVWHGYYITYFEDGREAFGRKHGISYLDIHAHNYTTPIVKSTCEHKLPLRYGEVATIETVFMETPAAKMIFQYNIYNAEKQLVCTGETIQVFVNTAGELALYQPDFFIEWKKRVGIL